MSESYEHCMECDSLTGRAGRAEDSLYHGYIGPFCEDCFEDWPDEQVAQITTLRQQLAKSKARVAELEAESLQAVANKVCGELPEGWVISLCMENGAAWVEAIKPSGYTIDIDRGDMSMVEQIDEALRVADERTGGIRR